MAQLMVAWRMYLNENGQNTDATVRLDSIIEAWKPRRVPVNQMQLPQHVKHSTRTLDMAKYASNEMATEKMTTGPNQ